MKDKSKPELLAPCGSWESLMAAIQAGCDSVYFGIEQLNMRARSAVNFSLVDLAKLSSIARKNKVKTYITLNTIIYDHDLSLMHTIIDEAKTNKIDAIIACDHAVISHARKMGMPVHISTQANITNRDSIEFYSQFADVMVLARELTLEQVKKLVKEIRRRKIKGPHDKLIRIEVFAHGALCMAVSGKCYLSLHSDFASANRGACVQNCRRRYVVADKESGTEFEVNHEYIMSAKDLCTIDFLDQLVDAGISVLKIEGRGRSEDYVYIVTKCYREAIDAIYSGNYSTKKIGAWKEELATVFNRGLWDGYYLGRKMGEWSEAYGSMATTRKTYVAKGLKYFDRIGIGEFIMESLTLSVGDQFLLSGPTTGVQKGIVEALRVNDEPRAGVKKGELFSMPVKNKIRPSDKLYKIIAS